MLRFTCDFKPEHEIVSAILQAIRWLEALHISLFTIVKSTIKSHEFGPRDTQVCDDVSLETTKPDVDSLQ